MENQRFPIIDTHLVNVIMQINAVIAHLSLFYYKRNQFRDMWTR